MCEVNRLLVVVNQCDVGCSRGNRRTYSQPKRLTVRKSIVEPVDYAENGDSWDVYEIWVKMLGENIDDNLGMTHHEEKGRKCTDGS